MENVLKRGGVEVADTSNRSTLFLATRCLLAAGWFPGGRTARDARSPRVASRPSLQSNL